MTTNLIKNINKLLESNALKNIYNDFFKERLFNKIIKLSIIDLDKDFYINFKNENIEICNNQSKEDVAISATSSSLLFYGISGKSDLFASKINISGDVETANALNSLLQESEVLRSIVIEIAGQKTASTVFSILDPIKSKMEKSTEEQNSAISNFLKFDINLVPSKEDINNYIDAVDDVKARTDKLLSKFK